MVRRTARLRDRKSKPKMDTSIRMGKFDYHEGLSSNQVKIILNEFGLYDRIGKFDEWMFGQTCPIISRYKKDGSGREEVCGVFEYDLFRWIESQRTGVQTSWD